MRIDLVAAFALALSCRLGWRFLLGMMWPPTLWRLLKLRLSKATSSFVAEEVVLELARQEQDYRAFLVRLFNSFEADSGVLRVVKELEERGYRVLLFSNIGHMMWQELCVRHCAVLAPFTDARVHCSHPPDYVHKPDPRAFIAFLSRFRRRTDEQFVLIDDSASNCRMAPLVDRAIGAILFTNARTLEALLRRWRVL
jgi:FMN phosphatase YigB (HAD superfamily)